MWIIWSSGCHCVWSGINLYALIRTRPMIFLCGAALKIGVYVSPEFSDRRIVPLTKQIIFAYEEALTKDAAAEESTF